MEEAVKFAREKQMNPTPVIGSKPQKQHMKSWKRQLLRKINAGGEYDRGNHYFQKGGDTFSRHLPKVKVDSE